MSDINEVQDDEAVANNSSEKNSIPTGRYRILERDTRLYTYCANSPNILLQLDLGKTVTFYSRGRFPKRTIFIDGAFSGAPFYDNRRLQYSLDHHKGCIRSFTLASCEQAAVVLFQGIPLDKGEWRLVINGVDLDSALAVWLLMNHTDLKLSNHKLLSQLMPTIRVEGVIDAHGMDGLVLAGYPLEQTEKIKAQLQSLLPLTRIGVMDTPEEASRKFSTLLTKMDELFMPPENLEKLSEFIESNRVHLKRNRLGIFCQSQKGIYEIEEYFKTRYGENLGIILQQREPGQYTIRLVDQFLHPELEKLYNHLNKLDPNVSWSHSEENQWGGAANIGGSPRATGSGLDSDIILSEIENLYGDWGSNFLKYFRRVRNSFKKPRR